VLFLIKAQANFERGSGFYFTETPLWSTKALLSCHGSWAELRHDTLLYVKQGAAEYAGGGDDLTFRTEPLPKPINYIEPNLQYWAGAQYAVHDLAAIARKYGMLTDRWAEAFSLCESIFSKSLDIVREECADSPVSVEQNAFIRNIPERLSRIVDPECNPDTFSADADERAGIIADAFTDTDTAQALEIGTGAPYRMQVLLNDGQGGKRVAVGYVYSYYEFYHPISDRLTDEQWREIVYDKNKDLSGYEPSWLKEIPRLKADGQ
jgi:hypothetical protein